MIEDKEIDIAARVQVLSKHVNETAYFQLRSIEDFKDGAKWMQEKFLKDLWHPIEKNPKKYHKCLIEVVYHRPLNMTDEIDYVTSHLTNFGWDESSFKRSDYTIKRWLYIEDLLSKEGGDNARV